MSVSPLLQARLNRTSLNCLILGLIAGVLALMGFLRLRSDFLASYLMVYFYWLSLTLGCMAVAMIHGMTGGRWGRVVRRVLEAGYETIPLMALLFIPIGVFAPSIYRWADPQYLRSQELVMKKAAWLTIDGFRWRALIYLSLWLISTWVLSAYSPGLDREDSPRGMRLQKISGFGFLMYGFTLTLAAVDWGMSLEPAWWSTMYALVHAAGQGVTAICFSVIVLVALCREEPHRRDLSPDRLNDLGSLMLAGVMFWAYCSFFQYLVIWSGNLPEENFWYVHRSEHGWQLLAIGLMIFHFGVPFFLLLSRSIKRNPAALGAVAVLLVFMHYIDLYWILYPGMQHGEGADLGLTLHWLNPVLCLMMGSFWVSAFTWRLGLRLQLPILDPNKKEKG